MPGSARAIGTIWASAAATASSSPGFARQRAITT